MIVDEIRTALLVMTAIAMVGFLGNLLLIRHDRQKRTVLATAFLLFGGGTLSLAQGWPDPLTYGLMIGVLILLFVDFAIRSGRRKDIS